MPIVTVTNQKGGVGKTTTTLHLAVALQRLGWNVLTVDFDPQGNLTTCCGLGEADFAEGRQTLADALLTTVRGPSVRKVTLTDVVISTPAGIDLVPADKHLAAAEAALYTVYGREYALRDTLATVRNRYDVILVDSVPTLGLLAINALAAANGIVIPVQADYLAVHGLAQLLESVQVVRERLNPDLEIWGVLLTMVDSRTRHCREVVAAVRESLPGRVRVFDTQIPQQVRLKDAAKAGVSIFTYDPSSRAAYAYQELASEIEPRLGQPLGQLTADGVNSLLGEPVAPLPADEVATNGAPNGGHAVFEGLANTSDGLPPSVPPPAEPTPNRKASQEGPDPTDVGPASPRIPLTLSPRAMLTGGEADGALLANGRRQAGICPKLGLAGDPSNHLASVSGEHRCFADSEPLEISSHAQRLYCLTDRYGTCGRYLRAQMRTQASSREQSQSLMARVRNVLSRSSNGFGDGL
jgi:chromosome partitioning protein